MYKKSLKVILVIVLSIMLFTNVTFAENYDSNLNLSDDEINEIMGKLECFNGTAENVDGANNSNTSGLKIVLQKELVSEMADDDLYFVYNSYDGSLGIQRITTSGKSEPIYFTTEYTNDAREYESTKFLYVDSSEICVDGSKIPVDNYVGDGITYLDELEASGQDVDEYYFKFRGNGDEVVPILESDLGENGIAFSEISRTTATSGSLVGVNVGMEGGNYDTHTIYADNLYSPYKITDVKQWNSKGTTTITSSDCELINGKYRYAFTVPEDGTYVLSDKRLVWRADGMNAGTTAGGALVSDEEGSIVLKAGQTCVIWFETDELADGKAIEISYNFLNSSTKSSNIDENIPDTSNGLFDGIERIFADLAIGIANLLNYLVSSFAHQTLTIDNIVFNEYDEIRIDFFSTDINGNEVVSNSGMVNALKNQINIWYKVFFDIALVGFMIILVYIGVKIMLKSTSADKKASYKAMFTSWVTGIAILFLFPYVMKYTILINDAFVTQIGRSRSLVAVDASNNSTQIDISSDFIYSDVENKIDYTASSKDYLSKMGYLAWNTKKLGFAIAFLVLTWQLIMLVIYYYKRVFMTAFLIIIFPIIAFNYVWDKLNDGKSQSLTAWTQEFMINVFVQSFHALVYIFITNTIYATLNGNNMDFILICIVSSFMFEGEEIMKQIFGGKGAIAAGSVAQTGVKLAASVKAVVGASKRIIKNTVGKDGLVRGTIATVRNIRRDNALLREDEFGISNLSLLARDDAREEGIYALLPKNGTIDSDIRRTAEIIDTFNHAESRSAEEVAKAIRDYKRLKEARKTMSPQLAGQFDAIVARSQISNAQLNALDKGMAASKAVVSNGGGTKKINQVLKLSVDYAFPNANTLEGSKVANKFYQATLVNMRDYGVPSVMSRKDVQDNWNKVINDVSDIHDKTKFAKRANVVDEKAVKEKVSVRASAINNRFITSISNYNSLSTNEKADLTNLSEALAVSEQIKTGVYSSNDVENILRELHKNYGRNQDVVNKVINDTVNVKFLESVVKNGGYDPKKAIVQNRVDGLIEQYEENVGKISADKMDIYREYAEKVAELEQSDAGVFSAYDYFTAVEKLDDGSDIADKMLKLSNIEADIKTLKYTLAKMIASENPGRDERVLEDESIKQYDEASKWARYTVDSMEKQARSRDGMPMSTSDIIDIIKAAEKTNGGKISSVDELLKNASVGQTAADGIMDEKFSNARRQNAADMMKIKEFAIDALKHNSNVEASDFRKSYRKAINGEEEIYDEPTYNGYAQEDIEKRRNAEIGNLVTKGTGLVVDLFATAPASIIGAAIGSASTDDGMPIEEAFAGTMVGAGVVGNFTDRTIPFFAGQSKRDAQSKELQNKVDERLSRAKAEKTKAKEAYDKAANKSAGKADTYLNLIGANASLYIDSNSDLHARIHIMAENAEYVSISENARNLNSSWSPYQEWVDYVFDDNDATKSHDLIIRIRDAHGNEKTAIIKNAIM